MEMSPTTPTILHADQEHGQLRTVVVFVILLAIFIGYQVMRAIFAMVGNTADYIYFFSCAGGIPIGLAISWVVEKGLKRIWPSGNYIKLDEDGLELKTTQCKQQSIEWDAHMIVSNWYFQLAGYIRGGRERRVPNSWVCLASQLRQEEQRVIVYTYMPPQKAEPWLAEEKGDAAFHEIKANDIYTNTLRDRFLAPARPDIPKQVLAGKDGTYWLAERRRWKDGVELTPEDFAIFMDYLKRKT